ITKWSRCTSAVSSSPFSAVLSYPIGQFVLGDTPIGERQYFGDDFCVRGSQIVPIHAEERDHGEKANAFVPVPIWVVLHQAEAIRGSQRRDVGFLRVVPLLLGPG